MKNKITLSVLFSFFGLCAFAQTIVTTNPENRKSALCNKYKKIPPDYNVPIKCRGQRIHSNDH